MGALNSDGSMRFMLDDKNDNDKGCTPLKPFERLLHYISVATRQANKV